MHRPSQGRGSSSFDGPGARPILGEAGPSTAEAKPSPPPPPGDDRPEFHPPPNAQPAGHSAPASVQPVIKRVGGKANVSSACGPCKRAHLACDVARPCKRCVNMGKEDQCEDVPHKKRGRPKVNKTPSNDPYPRPPRPTPPSASMDDSKWKPPPTYDSPYMTTNVTSPPVSLGSLAPRMPTPPRSSTGLSQMGPYDSGGPTPYSAPATASVSGPTMAHGPDDSPPIFTLFCSTELKILRATADCYRQTGYHPHEFANLSLLEWVHPSDRHLIEQDRNRLLNVPYLANHSLQSNRDTHAAVMAANERDLMSPAVGMREPYPNQNVHLLHSDNRFSLFNVRLHLGGGLGGSLWAPDTLGKIYLVVSCLSIPPEAPPPEAPGRRSRHAASPVTPMTTAPALPSFSSIAASVDAPPSSSPYPYQRPLSAHSGYYNRPPTASSSAGPYHPGPPAGARTPSPSQSSFPPPRYASYPPPGAHPSHPGYYPPPSGHYDRRPDTHPDEWRRHPPAPSPGTPGAAAEYRRGWE